MCNTFNTLATELKPDNHNADLSNITPASYFPKDVPTETGITYTLSASLIPKVGEEILHLVVGIDPPVDDSNRTVKSALVQTIMSFAHSVDCKVYSELYSSMQ